MMTLQMVSSLHKRMQAGHTLTRNVVGISRVQSKENPAPVSRPMTAEDSESKGMSNGVPNGLYKTGTAVDHQPFTENDLALAMKRSHLEVPAGGA